MSPHLATSNLTSSQLTSFHPNLSGCEAGDSVRRGCDQSRVLDTHKQADVYVRTSSRKNSTYKQPLPDVCCISLVRPI